MKSSKSFKKLKIKWSIKKAIISQKDKSVISFNEYINRYAHNR